MKIITTILFVFFTLVNISHAQYDSRKYIPEYVPYNFDDAVEMSDFSDCSVALEKFDEGYFLLEWKVISGSKEGVIYYRYSTTDPDGITSISQLKTRVEQEIRNCVSDYPNYILEKETAAAAKLAKQKAEEEAKERLKQIAKAISECDLDFFEKMTNSEKMQTYEGRMACEVKPKRSEIIPVTPPPATISSPIKIIPTLIEASPQKEKQITPISTTIQEDSSTTTDATSTDEVIKMTQDELDRIVEDKLNEKLNQIQEQPQEKSKPSIFRKVINFLFGWMF